MGLRSKSKDEIPVGTVWPYHGTTAPPGWLFCDGGSTAGYAALAAQIGSTTPDLRGRIPVGVGQGSGLTNRTLGATAGGETTATITTANMFSHQHGGGDHSHSLAYHTHRNGLHGHGGVGHTHYMGHDHGNHSHGGVIMTGVQSDHNHNADWGQTASSPQGFFISQSKGTTSAPAPGYTSFNSAGAGVSAEAPGTSKGNNNLGAAQGPSATVVVANGSGTGFAAVPPALGVQFIIKT